MLVVEFLFASPVSALVASEFVVSTFESLASMASGSVLMVTTTARPSGAMRRHDPVRLNVKVSLEALALHLYISTTPPATNSGGATCDAMPRQ